MFYLLIAVAAAQDNGEVPALNVQIFHSSVDGRVGFGLDDASQAINHSVTARAALQYINDPLVYQPDGGDRAVLVSDLLAVDAFAAYTFGRVRGGFDVPLYLFTAGDGIDGGFAMGDVSLDVKVTALDPADFPVGLAAVGRLVLPTAGSAAPVGSGGFGYELGLAGSQTFGDWQVALNVAQRGMPHVELENVGWGNQITWRAGVARSITDAAGMSLELSGASVWGTPLDNPSSSPIEAMLGGSYRFTKMTVARLGIGTGLTPGIGSPVARVIASVAMQPEEVRDADGDGIVDKLDACRDVPEDPDNFEDSDGCPDLDNDKDGLADTKDACPNEPEDHDQWQDDDGCPELLTDVHVRIVDKKGQLLPGATVGIGDQAGGAELTLQMPAGSFQLRAVAPDYVPLAESFSVVNGPPIQIVRTLEPDIKGGTLDLRVTRADGATLSGAWRADKDETSPVTSGGATAKLLPGAHTIDVYADGYASVTQKVNITENQTTMLTVVLQPAKVVMTAEKLDILDKIYFDTGKTTIKKISFPLLTEIARVIQDHPEILKIRVEGHTDSRGSDSANLKLSDGRAKAVQAWLVKAGIDPARLEAVGFGETRPVDPAENEAAWEKNRRVEFVIEKRAP